MEDSLYDKLIQDVTSSRYSFDRMYGIAIFLTQMNLLDTVPECKDNTEQEVDELRKREEIELREKELYLSIRENDLKEQEEEIKIDKGVSYRA